MKRRALVCAVMLALLGAVSARGAVAADSKLTVVRGVTPTSIKVGGLGDALLYSGADIGAKARFTRENTAGGVNGRTFDYVGLRDDQGVAATNLQAGTQLVEQDKVFAVVPTVTPDLGAVKVLTDQKVPYFGWAISSNFCGNVYGFGFTGCLFPPGGAHREQRVGRSGEDRAGFADPEPERGAAHGEHAIGSGAAQQPVGRREERRDHGRGRHEQPAGSSGGRLCRARDRRAQRERRKAAGRGVRGRRLLERRRNAEGTPRRRLRRAVHRHHRVRPGSRRVLDGISR